MFINRVLSRYKSRIKRIEDVKQRCHNQIFFDVLFIYNCHFIIWKTITINL